MSLLQVLFEDEDILVLEKPAGIPTQSARISEKDMVSLVKTYLFEKNIRGGEPYVGIVHRLDQPVEGIIVFGKTKASTQLLSAQIQEHKIQKHYKAVTCGHDIPREGRLEDYLRKNGRTNLSEITTAEDPNGKIAVLDYQILKSIDDKNLVEIDLVTGRHHQIRVQMANLGMPLWGDTKYNPQFIDRKGWFQIGLCSCRLEFQHPRTNKVMEFDIQPKGEIFKSFL